MVSVLPEVIGIEQPVAVPSVMAVEVVDIAQEIVQVPSEAKSEKSIVLVKPAAIVV